MLCSMAAITKFAAACRLRQSPTKLYCQNIWGTRISVITKVFQLSMLIIIILGSILLSPWYFNNIKCAQANLYTFREQWLFMKVYRFACAHFMFMLCSTHLQKHYIFVFLHYFTLLNIHNSYWRESNFVGIFFLIKC